LAFLQAFKSTRIQRIQHAGWSSGPASPPEFLKIRALRRRAVKLPYSAAGPEGNKTLQRK